MRIKIDAACRSYATETTAEAAIVKAGVEDITFLFVHQFGRVYPVLLPRGPEQLQRAIFSKFYVFG